MKSETDRAEAWLSLLWFIVF